MSHPVNEQLLESLYEECLTELFEKYKWDVISRLQIEKEASELAYKRFEELG